MLQYPHVLWARAGRILEKNYVVIIPVVNVDSYDRQNMRRVYTFSNGTTLTRAKRS